MKRNFISTLCLMGALLLSAGCSDEGRELSYMPTIELSGSNIVFPALGGTQEFAVKASKAVKATVDADWCRITGVKDARVILEADIIEVWKAVWQKLSLRMENLKSMRQ